MKFEEINYCMKRKCKNCVIDKSCQQLNETHKALTYKPFENISEILEKLRSKDE